MNPEIVRKYSAPVPRYTSYPTAPYFSPSIGAEQYAAWLAALPSGAHLSLYFHIPFCHTLCWYCGCSTKAVSKHAPITEYLQILKKEIATVSARLPVAHQITNIHWGGGSPNTLSPLDIADLDAATRSQFNVAANADFAVEIDPRTLTVDRVEAMAAAGVNRVSIGVQDFDPAVQAAINREQSFEVTKRAADWFRKVGIASINIDLVYGLPHQTRDSAELTIRKVLEIRPDRIAIFGYAHLPSRFRHQRLIDETVLPDPIERFAQSNRMANILAAAGYVSVGLDHFALPSDALAQGRITRNFQGYTIDDADALLGLGASAIGQLPQGYVQNAPSVPDYASQIEKTGLGTMRGKALTDDDRMRGLVIQRLMCDLSFPTAELKTRFGEAAQPLIEEAQSLLESDSDHLTDRRGDGFVVTDRGRPFIRSIAACFDSYLMAGASGHSTGV